MAHAALLLVALLLVSDAMAGQSAQTRQATIVHEQDVDVPMRDGVRLRADILRPAQGPSPTLVYRTPYGKHAALENYTIFIRAIERGYAVVVQDVRGRYASDGEFRPYANEGHDGYDTIEWASRQPWSNGRVGTFGLSYPGAVQWLAAAESPPHLQAMVPAMTFSTPQQLLLQRWRVGPVMARMDLAEHRAGAREKDRPAEPRTTTRRRELAGAQRPIARDAAARSGAGAA